MAALTSSQSSLVPLLDPWRDARRDMVSQQIEARGITEPSVLAAMRTVPRHRFLPPTQVGAAYADRPVTLAREQTISQPFVVAFMTAALQLQGTERVLEIGTGSGYHAAVLAECAGEVFSIELEPSLAHGAAHTLAELCYRNVRLREGDGSSGWPEAGPFDAIVLTAAPADVPPVLFEQLAVGGRLIAPVGGKQQELVLWTRGADLKLTRRPLLPVRFVPMRGAAARR